MAPTLIIAPENRMRERMSVLAQSGHSDRTKIVIDQSSCRWTPSSVVANFTTASREGLTPSPTCSPGQGGSRKGMRPLRQRNGSRECQPSSDQTDGGFYVWYSKQ